MTTTWADIQRLAADLQRVQLAEGTKKLSERNCVEVVSMLMASKAIDVVFTSDGHAYLTKKHLLTEIKNECIGRGGRVSLSDLAHTLNVDYEHIENSVAVILKQSSSFVLCNAELIARDYVDSLCMELNERLSETGVLSASQLIKTWDLPSEIFYGLVLTEIGSKVEAMIDGDTIYTSPYLSAQRNLLRAILNALTKVTPMAKLSAHLNLSPSIFWSIYDDLAANNEVPGTVAGGRSSNLAHYVPNRHGMLVRSFVLKCFEQEKMIATSTLRKLSIVHANVYLKDVLPKSEFASLIFFPSAIISKELWDEIEALIKNEMEKMCYCDLSLHMPAAISSDQDVQKAISICVKSSKEWMSASGQPFVYNSQLLASALKALNGLISDRAEKEAEVWSRQHKNAKREEKPQEEDWTTGKGKKGRGGKGKGNKQTHKEEQLFASARFSAEELVSELERVTNLPKELLEEIVEQICANAEAVLRARIETLVRTVQTVSAQDQKRSHVQMQEKIRALYNNICIFEQATSSFDDVVATDLRAYLIRTLCTDVANIVLSYISGTENTNALTIKIRDETISSIENAGGREAVAALFAAVSGADLDAFHSAMSSVSSPAVCSLNLKMPDKKQRTELVQAYASELERQLRACDDAASGLLISLLLILAKRNAIAVHASGKFVSHIIAKVEKVANLSAEQMELLVSMQKLVIASMKNKTDVDLKTKLVEKLKSLKSFLLGVDYVEESSKGGKQDGEDGVIIELTS
uniref:E3 UFM1-protein ligase 1 homolog n=2 Tax=Parascaris univalens TaxID=6257 RepID=A0A915BQR0_PARUN